LAAHDAAAVKAAVTELPEESREQLRLKLTLMIETKLHLDYVQGVNFFLKVASVPQHAGHAAAYYRNDLRQREELAQGTLRVFPSIREEQQRMLEEVRRSVERLGASTSATPATAPRHGH
ncbi:MAG TPA: hypothetical protein VNX25_09925, partial [Verrucomicrobiae bacterium]|nr:hypothetical protein [Verrucomicrobiae bacterium]